LEENEFSVEYILENGLDKSAYGFVYITTNYIGSKKYIGQKMFESISKRWKGYLGSGKILKQAIKKYGKENFTRKIIAIAYSKEELNELEIEFIKLHNATVNKDYYNIGYGGEAVNTGLHHSEEHKRKIREWWEDNGNGLKQRTGRDHPFYGKHHTEKSKEKMRETRGSLNVEQIVEIREKYATGNYTHVKLAKEYSIARSVIGRIINHEGAYKTIYEGEILITDIIRTTKVICLTTGKIFDSIMEASNYYGINRSIISTCCAKRQKLIDQHSIANELLVWAYYDDYIKSNQFPTAI